MPKKQIRGPRKGLWGTLATQGWKCTRPFGCRQCISVSLVNHYEKKSQISKQLNSGGKVSVSWNHRHIAVNCSLYLMCDVTKSRPLKNLLPCCPLVRELVSLPKISTIFKSIRVFSIRFNNGISFKCDQFNDNSWTYTFFLFSLNEYWLCKSFELFICRIH